MEYFVSPNREVPKTADLIAEAREVRGRFTKAVHDIADVQHTLREIQQRQRLEILEAARRGGVRLHISTLQENGHFDA